MAPGTAHAGAWVTAGEDRSITTFGYSRDDEIGTIESDIYTEKTLTSRLALVGHTFYSEDGLGEERDEADLGVKVLGYRTDRIALALQGGVTWRSETEPACPDVGGEIRGLAGRSSASGKTFLNGEAAYRYANGCSHARYEVTAGWRPNDTWLALGQVFIDDDLRYGETIKAQASLVRFTTRGRGLQISARIQVQDGDVIEPTIILGYWSAKRR